MGQYSVRLQSQTDEQWRVRSLEADSVDDAAKRALALESNRVKYSLLDRQPVKSIQTAQHADGVHATVNASAFADTGLGGHDLLAYCEREHAVEANGKAQGPNLKIKAHLAAHYQNEPYKVVSAELWKPQISDLVTLAQGLSEHEGEWDKALKALKDAGISTAAVTGSLYGLQAQKNVDGSAAINWVTGTTLQCSLHTVSYVPNQDTDDFFNDATNEVTGTGYTAKGVTLASKASTYDTATDQARLDAADVSWTTSTITARIAVVWQDTAGASTTDPVIGWLNFGADVSTTAGTFQITWDATGIVVYDVT